MKKMFIDDIKKKGDVSSPGPGRYEEKKKFGDDGAKKCMGSRLLTGDLALDKSAKLPGPGSYENPDVTGQKVASSVIQNS